ncbi:MAG: glycosyltransferase family 39 protein [Bacteroidales bacterium]
MQRVRDLIISFTKNHPLVLFYSVLALIGFFYFYHTILFSPPQSIHRWRQADCLSITLNYYQHGMNMIKPELHLMISDDMNSGYAACEAPLLYYFVALLYKIFGPHEYIYRIVNVLILFIGLGALFRISLRLLHNFVAAAFVPLLVFVSPVMAYYGNNFLTDSTALALVFIGWWQYFRYTEKGNYKMFAIAILLFTLAGLLKVTMLINLAALGCLGIAWHLRIRILRDHRPLFPGAMASFLPMMICLIVIATWYLYAIYYNRLHHTSAFLTTVTPWWAVSKEFRKEITPMIMSNFPVYYSIFIRYFLLASLLVCIVFFRHIPKYLGILTALLLVGGVVYISLFYTQFIYHDYYLIVLFSAIAFLVLTAILAIKHKYPGFFGSWIFAVSLIVILVFNVIHARKEMHRRYFGSKRETPVFESLFTIRPYLKSIGIKPEDRVITIPDNTYSYTLYLMNQPGYRIWKIDSTTPGWICAMIDRSARYLVVNDSTYLNKPELRDFTENLVGHYQEVKIFRLSSCPLNDSLMKK